MDFEDAPLSTIASVHILMCNNKIYVTQSSLWTTTNQSEDTNPFDKVKNCILYMDVACKPNGGRLFNGSSVLVIDYVLIFRQYLRRALL